MSLSVSVIICCYTQERLDDIREAVISVQRQTRPPDEIILAVDNNRALYDLLKAEFAGVARVILNESARGLSVTRNAGVAVAQGDLVVFLDDDAVADPDWLLHITGPLEEDSAVVGAGGRTILHWLRARPLWFAEELDWTVGGSYRGMPERRSETRNPHGNNMCFLRSALLEVAGFEPAFGRVGQGGQAGEEAELCLRLRRKLPWAKILYEPRAVVRHKVPPSRARMRYIVKRCFQEGFAKAMIAKGLPDAGRDGLSTERAYLRHLLVHALPMRVLRLWDRAALTQVAAILLFTTMTATGYVLGFARSVRYCAFRRS